MITIAVLFATSARAQEAREGQIAAGRAAKANTFVGFARRSMPDDQRSAEGALESLVEIPGEPGWQQWH
jgi:hypothetical protein